MEMNDKAKAAIDAAVAEALRARVAELEKTLKEQAEQSIFEGEREHLWNASFNAATIERAEKAEAQVAELKKEKWAHVTVTSERTRVLEAQVAAAREACTRLIDRPWSRWAGDAGRDVLRAMDEAAK